MERCTAAPALSVVVRAVEDAWQPTVVHTWSVPETIVQLRVRGDSVSTHALEPVLRMPTCSRGSTPAGYLLASVDAVTASWSRRQAPAATVGELLGVGEELGVDAEGWPDPDPPLQETAMAMVSTTRIASSAARRVQYTRGGRGPTGCSSARESTRRGYGVPLSSPPCPTQPRHARSRTR